MFLRYAGLKLGQRRNNPDLVKKLESGVNRATCIAELLLGMNSLYGSPLKQVVESVVIEGKVRLRWVDKNKLYKFEFALADDGTWFALGKPLNLNDILASNLTALFEDMHQNETYLYDNEIEPLFITHRDYYDIAGRKIRGLTVSKVRSLPNTSKFIINNKQIYTRKAG